MASFHWPVAIKLDCADKRRLIDNQVSGRQTNRGGGADLYILLPLTGWPIASREPGLPSAARTTPGKRSLSSDRMIGRVVQAKPGVARM